MMPPPESPGHYRGAALYDTGQEITETPIVVAETAVAAVGGTIIRLRRYCRAKLKFFFLGGALLLASTAMAAAGPESDDEVRVSDWYIGVGLGVSRLEPDPNNTNYRVTEENDSGWVVFAGRDLSEHWTAEVLYSDLGSAEMTNQSIPNQIGEVSYEVFAITSQYYFNQKPERGFRRGWQPYLRLGFAWLQAEQHNFINTSVRQVNDSQLYYGGGIEYSWDNRWALRGGIDVYDVDAMYAGITLLKRFGGSTAKRAPVEQAALVEEPVSEPESTGTDEPIIAYSDVCTQFEGVNFWHGSADLTEKAMQILESVTELLIQNPQLKIEIQAHTDSRGTAEGNQILSDARAETVRNYLVENGIDASRLSAIGYGETMPEVSNDTVPGRAENRRVEFRVTDESFCQ